MLTSSAVTRLAMAMPVQLRVCQKSARAFSAIFTARSKLAAALSNGSLSGDRSILISGGALVSSVAQARKSRRGSRKDMVHLGCDLHRLVYRDIRNGYNDGCGQVKALPMVGETECGLRS